MPPHGVLVVVPLVSALDVETCPAALTANTR
jgi:hypothetical protein